MATIYGREPRKALSFAVEKHELIMCMDTIDFLETGSFSGSNHILINRAFQRTDSFVTGSWYDVDNDQQLPANTAQYVSQPGTHLGGIPSGSLISNRSGTVVFHPEPPTYMTFDGAQQLQMEQFAYQPSSSTYWWIRTTETSARSLQSHSSGGPVGWATSMNASGYLAFDYYVAPWILLNASGSVPLNNGEWHHVGVIRRGEDIDCYTDGSGSFFSKTNTFGSGGTPFSGGTTNDIFFGRWNLGQRWIGDFATVHMYNKSHDAATVKRIFEHQRLRFGV